MVNGFKPRSLAQALSLRRTTAAVPYAGGTSRLCRPDDAVMYLYLDGCPELRRIDTDGHWLHIGAGSTFTQLLNEPLTPELLRAAVEQTASPAVRNVATLGGALCGDGVGVNCALYACGAQLTLASETGRRTMTPQVFFRRGRGLNLSGDELLCEILTPALEADSWSYATRTEEPGSPAVTFAGTFRWELGRLAAFTAVFGGAASRVLRFPEFERELLGRTAAELGDLKPAYLTACDRAILAEQGADADDTARLLCLELLGEHLARCGV